MVHIVKKNKFRGGQDANQMLVRKLARNFLLSGKIKITIRRAKVLKPIIESYIEKAKKRTESNKNFLLSKLADVKTVESLFTDVGTAMKDIKGGYVKITRIGYRDSDGSEVAFLEWAHPVVKDVPVIKPTETNK